MRSTTLLTLSLWASSGLASPAGGLFERAACNKDNCYNAVASKTTVNTKDCQSFMTRTVTPCPSSTVTSTRTVVVTSSIGSAAPKSKRGMQIEARQVTGAATCPTTPTNTAVPTYASSCSGTVRYSSACSCIGVTTGITTAPSPLATTYKTTTTTTTVTAVYSTFKVKATSGAHAGQYLARGKANGNTVVDPTVVVGFTPNVALAETYVIVSNGSIYGMGGNPPNPDYIWRVTGGISLIFEESYNNDVAPVIKCSLSPLSLSGNAVLGCIPRSSSTIGFWQECPTGDSNAPYLGAEVYPGTEGPGDACFGIGLVTVPVTA